jgi:hypothetical protein
MRERYEREEDPGRPAPVALVPLPPGGKRRIEDTVEDVAGVRQVHDFLHVRNPRGATAGPDQPTGPGGRTT